MPATRENPHAAALFDDLRPVAIQLRFVEPGIANRRGGGRNRYAGRDETKRRRRRHTAGSAAATGGVNLCAWDRRSL